MDTITLEGMEFFAKHGVSDAERSLGNRYRVDVCIETNLWQAAQTDNVEHTIDYGTVYQIVAQEIEKPAKLLEHIAGNIANSIFSDLPRSQKIAVSLYKYNPPIGGLCTWAKVHLEKERSQ
jgi:7,8-dihydroneopterin aldolase/epimerase/oxygenase